MGAGISGGGPRGAHEAGARALCPRGQMVGPPGVFLVPGIIKDSTGNHISFSRCLENFYFQGIFYCKDNSENTPKKILFSLYLI